MRSSFLARLCSLLASLRAALEARVEDSFVFQDEVVDEVEDGGVGRGVVDWVGEVVEGIECEGECDGLLWDVVMRFEVLGGFT